VAYFFGPPCRSYSLRHEINKIEGLIIVRPARAVHAHKHANTHKHTHTYTHAPVSLHAVMIRHIQQAFRYRATVTVARWQSYTALYLCRYRPTVQGGP